MFSKMIALAATLFSSAALATTYADIDYPGNFTVPVRMSSDFVELTLRNNTSPRSDFSVNIGMSQGLQCQVVRLSPYGRDATLLVRYNQSGPRTVRPYCELSWWPMQNGHVRVRIEKY